MKQPTTHQQRSVSFDLAKSEYFQLCCHHDDSDAVALSKKDYKKIAENNSTTVRQMDLRHLPDNDEFYFRGLESKTILGSRKRRLYRSHVLQAMFTEQDRQRHENNPDIELLAKAYERYSTASQAQAHRLAHQDALAAQEVFLEADIPIMNLAGIIISKHQHKQGKASSSEDDWTVSTAGESFSSSYDEYE